VIHAGADQADGVVDVLQRIHDALGEVFVLLLGVGHQGIGGAAQAVAVRQCFSARELVDRLVRSRLFDGDAKLAEFGLG